MPCFYISLKVFYASQTWLKDIKICVKSCTSNDSYVMLVNKDLKEQLKYFSWKVLKNLNLNKAFAWLTKYFFEENC
jgi:hypothetical protein